MNITTIYHATDAFLKKVMRRWSVPFLRASFGIIFIWFGILKPLRLSPAEGILMITVDFLPVFETEQWLPVIGWLEVAIGCLFLFRKTTKIAIGLLYLQMAGTFIPLFLYPEVTFENGWILQPTPEGQYYKEPHDYRCCVGNRRGYLYGSSEGLTAAGNKGSFVNSPVTGPQDTC